MQLGRRRLSLGAAEATLARKDRVLDFVNAQEASLSGEVGHHLGRAQNAVAELTR